MLAAQALNLPFLEAESWFRKKLNLPTETWADIRAEDHGRAFTVAGAAQEDLLADFRDAVTKAIVDGTTLAEFRRDFDAIVSRYGWSYNGSRGWRSNVIYQTNTRQAYNAGRWKQQTDPEVLATRPYLLYRHMDSMHPRPEHQAWDGLVLPADDPWWDTHYPANGWGCKCRVFSLDERGLRRMGKSGPDSAPDNGTYEWTHPKTGQVLIIPKGIDPGFDYNPGKSGWQEAA